MVNVFLIKGGQVHPNVVQQNDARQVKHVRMANVFLLKSSGTPPSAPQDKNPLQGGV